MLEWLQDENMEDEEDEIEEVGSYSSCHTSRIHIVGIISRRTVLSVYMETHICTQLCPFLISSFLA